MSWVTDGDDPTGVLSEGLDADLHIAWQAKLQESDRPGRLRGKVHYLDSWQSFEFPRRRGSLHGDRSWGVVHGRAGTVLLLGTVASWYDRVFADFGDGTEKDGCLVKIPDLPAKLYVLFVDRRPARLVATTTFGEGGGEWIDNPVSAGMPCGSPEGA